MCSKLMIKTPEWRHWRRSGVFVVNFEHISHLFLVFLLLTLKKWMLAWNLVIFQGILQNYPNILLEYLWKSTSWLGWLLSLLVLLSLKYVFSLRKSLVLLFISKLSFFTLRRRFYVYRRNSKYRKPP